MKPCKLTGPSASCIPRLSAHQTSRDKPGPTMEVYDGMSREVEERTLNTTESIKHKVIEDADKYERL